MHPIAAIIEKKRRFLFVLGLLLLALVAMAGVLFTEKKTTTDSTAGESVTHSDTVEEIANEQQEAAVPLSAAADYIVLPAWNVRFKRSVELRDVTLTMKDAGDSQTIFFSSEELAALDPNCDAESGQLGLLERSETPLNDAAGPREPDVQVGDYFYYYSAPQALCLVAEGSSTADNQALIDRQQTAVAAAIKTLETNL